MKGKKVSSKRKKIKKRNFIDPKNILSLEEEKALEENVPRESEIYMYLTVKRKINSKE